MAQCSGPGCLEFRFDIDAALAEGWLNIDNEPYCPLHAPGAAWRAKKAADRAELEAAIERRAAAQRNDKAKRTLLPPLYAEWDKFQSDLADYHREHGRLAHPAVRTLSPDQWMRIHVASGPIDVEEAVRHTEAAEAAHKTDRERLARGL